MKSKVYIILNIILFFAFVGLLVYAAFILKDNSRVLQSLALIAGVLFNLIRSMRVVPSGGNYAAYEDAYRDMIAGAFAEDKKSYKKLLKAIVCFDQDKYKKAHRILNKLSKKCTRAKDYDAIYMFHALCYNGECKLTETIEAYQKVLQYNATNSRAWSNLGKCYITLGDEKAAFNAYSNAILYDSANPYAHVNMAVYYIDTKQPQSALEHALKAFELNANLPQAMSAAAVAYKMLDDDKNTEKFCQLYQMNGGNLEGLLYRLNMIEDEKQDLQEEEE